MTGRADLSDVQWAVLEPLLPVGKRPGRPPKWPKRQLINGIRWRVRVGAPWRDVPSAYGSWQAVYGLFRRWQRAGVWAAILARLQARADAAGWITWDVSVDSTIARAHQHAAGARKRGARRKSHRLEWANREPADHALGRSRGGWSTKLHPATEQGQTVEQIVPPGGTEPSPVITIALATRPPLRD
ncbi:IS5 family transposase [Actinophytocola sp.]|uniref:IS5 family transposase n=1 Tax=Actinophytocola sp. TaxID=1872138 RepID=UPI002DBDDE67|nr:IS5 family transposase [Actinophytocola sp.]